MTAKNVQDWRDLVETITDGCIDATDSLEDMSKYYWMVTEAKDGDGFMQQTLSYTWKEVPYETVTGSIFDIPTAELIHEGPEFSVVKHAASGGIRNFLFDNKKREEDRSGLIERTGKIGMERAAEIADQEEKDTDETTPEKRPSNDVETDQVPKKKPVKEKNHDTSGLGSAMDVKTMKRKIMF